MSTISIIGSGGMAASAAHTVEVVSRDPAKARALAKQIGAGGATGTYGVARGTSSSWPCLTPAPQR